MVLRSYYLTILFLVLFAGCKNEEKERNPTNYVNPFIETANGHYFPGVVMPFGKIRLNPDNLRLLPVISKPENEKCITEYISSCYAKFSHDNEYAEPGYYKVKLDNGIVTELSTTDRCGIYYYQYPKDSVKALMIDWATAYHRDTTIAAGIKKINNRTVEGFRQSKGGIENQPIYYVMEFSQDIHIFAGKDSLTSLDNGQEFTGDSCYAWINWGDNTNKVLVKISTSTINCDEARTNLKKELPHWSFDKVRKDNKAAWRRELQKIKVESDDKNALQTFYTAMYQAYIAFQYSAFSPLDIQQANIQLFTTLLKQEVVGATNTIGKGFARYVLSAVGFDPEEGKYLLTTPLFHKITLKVGPEKTFVITTKRDSKPDTHIENRLLNGNALGRNWITYEEIMQGGKLE